MSYLHCEIFEWNLTACINTVVIRKLFVCVCVFVFCMCLFLYVCFYVFVCLFFVCTCWCLCVCFCMRLCLFFVCVCLCLFSYVFVCLLACLLAFGATAPQWSRVPSYTMYLDHAKWRTTAGKTSLDEWSDRRRDLCLTSHNSNKRQVCLR
jgi:hypothetical protein